MGNKSINNNQILDAVRLLKKNKCNTNVNIIFGLPGYNERQSIEELKRTVGALYLNDDIDIITISPLVTRRNTLQGLIEKNKLMIHKINLVTLFVALIEILSTFPGIENKMVISPPNFQSFVKENIMYDDKLSIEILHILQKYVRIGKNIKWKELLECSILENKDLFEYKNQIMEQSSYEEIQNDLYNIALSLSQIVFKEKKKEMIEMFSKELKEFIS